MSPDVYTILLSKKTELSMQRARIDAEIADIDQALKVINKYGSEQDLLGSAAMAMNMLAHPRGMTKQQQIIQGAIEVLVNGKILHTAELLSELQKQGIDIGGSNPEANLSAYLSKAKEVFKNDRKYGWSLVNKNGPDVDAPEPFTVDDHDLLS